MIAPMPQVDVLVFAGQGTSAANSPQVLEQALHDAASPSGRLLLSACYEAFHNEFASLSADEVEQTNVTISHFNTHTTLLAIPQGHYAWNPIISGTRLFLIQSLRYLGFEQPSRPFPDVSGSFNENLKKNSEYGIGILGFSSGILPACVVGTSFSAAAYIARATQAYRLAFWIGVRTQMYRRRILKMRGLPGDCALPWSRVFHGMSKEFAEQAIAGVQNQQEEACLFVTAVVDDQCVTISGFPDILDAFSDTIRTGFTVHNTTIDTLYHSPVHVSTRHLVLADVSRRAICFPDFADIKIPIRSPFTGNLIDEKISSGSLVESVIDTILVQPVNWDLTMSELLKICHVSMRLVNVGPGTGLIRGMEKMFPHGTVSHLDLTAADRQASQQISPNRESIAIVGMAVNMPGARNTSELWENLEKNINTIAEIPETRFKVSDYNDPEYAKPGRTMKTRIGNFIDGFDEFDNEFFRISPREAKSMDPQQRLLLHTAYEALENAGYVPNATPSFQQDTFGCYIGAATHDYSQNLRDDIDVYYNTGTLKAFLSGRISYVMQLGGPSIVVDTACSSSSVALYQGCRALMYGDCRAALVGGVNVITSPDMFIGLDRGHMLSPTGQCKAFDASADGYARSEGCGIFILKRLSDARSENDNILGIIRGIEVNQSGLARSITRPHFPSQTALFKQLLEKSGIEAHRVNVIEAHGTGTKAGDPTEVASIRSVFGVQRRPDNPLYITSIKANIGHLEAASGAAGLAKLLLMLEHRIIPRQISLQNLNPDIASLELDHTIIPTSHTHWASSHDGMTRVALLNNFGAAGSNAALLVEEYRSPIRTIAEHRGMSYVFGLSAKTQSALGELRSRYLQWLQSPASEGIQLGDIAYTMTARRQIYAYRLAVSASRKTELVEKLSQASVVELTHESANVGFVFSGQGSQYLGMGKALYRTCPSFQRLLEECHYILIASGFPGILQIIIAEPEGSGLSTQEEFEAYQAAVVSLEYSLAQLWMSWGLTPAVVVGHSLGEYSALIIANVLTLKDALILVATRARLMVQKCALECTGMLAVNAGPVTVNNELGSSVNFAGLSIVCFNSPVDCVASGPIEQLQAFKTHMDCKVRCKSSLLSVPFGYHSAAMHPLIDDLTLVAQRVTINAPTVPIISTVLGGVVLPGDHSVFDASYFSRHCMEPVLFESGINTFLTQSDCPNIDAWIEIGPHTTLLPMLKSNSHISKEILLLGSLRKQQDAWLTLTNSLSQLYRFNVTIRWREVFMHLSTVSCVKLPSYPFLGTKFWVPFKERPESFLPNVNSITKHLVTDFSMLHSWVQYPSNSNGHVAIFETPISELSDSIQGHKVGGLPLCPVSVYLEQIFAGIHLAHRKSGLSFDDHHVILNTIEFINPLVYDVRIARTVRTSITLGDGSSVFTVSSLARSSTEEVIHVHGTFRFQLIFETETKFSLTLPTLTEQILDVINRYDRGLLEVFSSRTAYEIVFPRVVEYSESYRTMQSIIVDSSSLEGYATVKLPANYDKGNYVVHPVFIDTLLHVAGFVANLQSGVNDIFICTEVASVKVITGILDNEASYGIYCRNAWFPDEGLMMAEVYAILQVEPRRIVAHLEDVHFRRVRLDSLKRGLASSVGGSPCPNPCPNSSHSTYKSPDCLEIQGSTTCRMPQDGGDVVAEIEAEVFKLVSETCDLEITAFDRHTDLAALGIDSLLSIELLRRLQEGFPDADLSLHLLSRCQSLGEIASEIWSSCTASPKSVQGSSGASSPRTLVYDEKTLEQPTLDIDQELDMKRVLASVLYINNQDLDDDADLEALGLDSLGSMEALYALQREFGLELPHNLFTTCRTLRAVNSFLASQCNTGRAVSPAALPKPAEEEPILDSVLNALRLRALPIPIQHSKDPQHVPLFLVHDGSGFINYYDRLPPLERNVWAIHNPYIPSGKTWESLSSMAIAYARYVVGTTSGPVLLGGWSFGGVVAFEIARYLLKKGVDVKGVLLIDPPSPLMHTPLSDSLLDHVIDLGQCGAGSDISRVVKTQFEMNSRLLGSYDPFSNEWPWPRLALLRSGEGFDPPGVLNVPGWLADRTEPTQVISDWESLVGTTVKVWAIPGHHFQPFDSSFIVEVSRRIADGCQYLENL